MNNYKTVLLYNILINLGISIVITIAGIGFLLGKSSLLTNKNIVFKTNIYKIIYTRIIPSILLLGILYLNYSSVSDYIKPDFKSTEGVLNSISYSSRNFKQYNVRIDEGVYSIPLTVKDPQLLIKGKKYKITFTSRKKIIVEINQID